MINNEYKEVLKDFPSIKMFISVEKFGSTFKGQCLSEHL